VILDEILGPLERDGDCFTGAVHLLPGTSTPITIESDYIEPTDEDLQDAIRSAKSIFQRLDPQFEADIRGGAAATILVAAYSQSDEKPLPDEVQQLAAEMVLEGINFFPDHAMFVWRAASSFPDRFLIAQIDRNLRTEDVMIQP
jgi:hypothetical protein